MKMNQYKNKFTGETVFVKDKIACGMCSRTIGRTLVIYKFKEDDFHRVMDHIEFYEQHEKI